MRIVVRILVVVRVVVSGGRSIGIPRRRVGPGALVVDKLRAVAAVSDASSVTSSAVPAVAGVPVRIACCRACSVKRTFAQTFC